MAIRYVPDRGDIVWLRFDPSAGREQAGRRPALVISPKSYNRRSGLAVMCPIRSRVKGHPFELELPDGLEAQGAVLCDQIKNLDWRFRRASRWCVAPTEVVDEVTGRILALVDPKV